MSKLSRISAFHYFRLCFRGSIFLWAVVLFFLRESFRSGSFEYCQDKYPWLFITVWIVLAVEMVLRFFPSHTESMGCQKQFARNYIKNADAKPNRKQINRGVFACAASWIGLNGAFALMHWAGWIHDGALLLIALFYSVSDMICILFFCPFQTWMMKNRCCTTCRIYNWDYAMICTPLMLIWSSYTWSLATLSIILLLRWEITAAIHPERFSVEANKGLRCKNCEEKLCRHKKQLHRLWRKENIFLSENKHN